MSALIALAEAVAPQPQMFQWAWGVVASVTQSTTTTVVAFDLYGSTGIDAATTTNLHLSGAPALAAGDKILVGRAGSGAWVIIDKIEVMGGSG